MNPVKRICVSVITAAASLAGWGPPAAAQGVSATAVRAICAGLRGETIGAVVISTAWIVAAGRLAEGGEVPEHCLIEGAIEERTGADGKHYAINIQLRVPTRWDGRLVYQGGGGLNGMVGLATGNNPTRSTAPNGLQRGMAVVATDSGHAGKSMLDPAFAKDSQAKIDFAYGAIGKVTMGAKAILNRVAGREPHHTYFSGCSNGGREALVAAQRYPTLFDGVAAGNPAFNVTQAGLMAYFSTQQYRAAGVTAEDLRLVGEAPAGSPLRNWGPIIVDAAVREVFAYPPLSPAELKRMDFAVLQKRMAWGSAIIDATSTDFSTFRALRRAFGLPLY